MLPFLHVLACLSPERTQIQDVWVFLVTATKIFFTPQTKPGLHGDGGRKKGGEKKRSQRNKTVCLLGYISIVTAYTQ